MKDESFIIKNGKLREAIQLLRVLQLVGPFQEKVSEWASYAYARGHQMALKWNPKVGTLEVPFPLDYPSFP